MTDQNSHSIGTFDGRAYEYAGIFYAVGYLVVLAFAWCVKYPAISAAIPQDQSYCAQYGSVCSMVGALGGDIRGRSYAVANMLFAYLAVTNIRIVLASMLCHSQTSPLRRAVSEQQKGALGKLVLLYTLIKLIALTSLWRAYLLGTGEPWLLPAGLFLESVLIVAFDVVFWPEMKKVQQYLVFVGMDIGALLFSTIWLAQAVIPGLRPTTEISTYFLGLFGGVFAIFLIFAVIEAATYVSFFVTSIKNLRRDLKGMAAQLVSEK